MRQATQQKRQASAISSQEVQSSADVALTQGRRAQTTKSSTSTTQRQAEPSTKPMPATIAADESSGDSKAAANGQKPRRRATAQSMAASQRDISVSEFFAKNRHLLGFDNPRKALLTTVKEAVDNSLDACEEAGILPEIWVHIEADRHQPLQGRRAGQRPGHSQEADPADLRQAAVRLEVSPPADEPRPAGHRHQRRRHVRRAHDRQAGEDRLQDLARKPAHYYEIKIDTKKNCPRFSTARAKATTFRRARPAASTSPSTASSGSNSAPRHARHDRARRQVPRGRGSVDEYLEQTAIANPHVTIHYLDPGIRTPSEEKLYRAPPINCRPSRRRSSRTLTASSWACW